MLGKRLGSAWGMALLSLVLASPVLATPQANPWLPPAQAVPLPPVWVPVPAASPAVPNSSLHYPLSFPAGLPAGLPFPGWPFMWVPLLPAAPQPVSPPAAPAPAVLATAPAVPISLGEPEQPAPDWSVPARRLLALAEADIRVDTRGTPRRVVPEAAHIALEQARVAAEANDPRSILEHALTALEALRAPAPRKSSSTNPPPSKSGQSQSATQGASTKPSAAAKPTPSAGKRKLCWKGDRLDVCP